MTDSRIKMAFLPEGADVLPNSVGVAPGIKLKINDKIIYSLPGVPSEMKAIFEMYVLKELKFLFSGKKILEKTLETDLRDESKLTEIVKEIVKFYPEVYIKSLPTYFGDKACMRLYFLISERNNTNIELKLDNIIEELKVKLNKIGYSLITP